MNKRQRNILHRSILRGVIQILFFLTMPGAFVAGFAGVKNAAINIGQGTVISIGGFSKAFVGICFFTILCGRFFCGYACAFGSFGDFISFLSGVFQKKVLGKTKKYRIPDKIARILQMVKYINLVCIIIFCASGLISEFSGWSVWDVFSKLTALELPTSKYLVGIILLGVLIIGMGVEERFFCQFLCPMGAVFSLLPVIPWSISTGQRNSINCSSQCGVCKSNCPVHIKLEKDGILNGECIGCEKCISICPKQNISHSGKVIKVNDILLIGLKACALFSFGVFLGL